MQGKTSFRVANIDAIKEIASNMTQESSTADNTFKQTDETLTELCSNMKGEGVDEALKKLQTEVSNVGSATITLMNDINTFIMTQLTQYQSVNTDASANLKQILSDLQTVDASKGNIKLS